MVERVARFLEDVLVAVLIKVVGVSSSWREIRAKRYELAVFDYESLSNIDVEHAKFFFEQIQASQEKTDEKVAHLLTLSGSLAGFTSIVGAFILANLTSTLVVGALVGCVVLCLANISVRTERVPDLVDASDERYNVDWAKELLRSANDNYGWHAYRVDIFRAARRWFLLAMIGGVLLILLAWVGPAEHNTTVDDELVPKSVTPSPPR
jgi:hypothetical protein